MTNWRIPLSDISISSDEQQAVLAVLKSGWLSMGEQVESFEREFAEYLGVPYAVAVANGTAALHLALMALDIGPGDEVIQPALNFVAAANMTLSLNATPVFVDIEAVDTPTCDPDEIEQLITPRTKAVIVMHYGGQPCNMARILDVCNRHGIAVIEDACHAIGAKVTYRQDIAGSPRFAGALGDVGCFSFFSNKNMVTGEGGMFVSSQQELWRNARLLRSHGMTTMSWDRFSGHASSYDVVRPGFNYRMDDIHAALGRLQLSKLETNNAARLELVREYTRRLRVLDGWIIPFLDTEVESAHHLMVVVAPNAELRDLVVQRLHGQGVQTSLHYPYIPDFTPFRAYAQRDLPRTRNFAQRAVSLPLYPRLEPAQVQEICDLVQATALEAVRLKPAHTIA